MPARPEAPIAEDRPRGIMPRRSGDPAARVSARAAQIQALERHPVIGGADHRPRAEQLVETHLAVENVAADRAEAALEIERGMDLAADNGFGEARRVRVDRRDDLVGSLV